MPPTSTTSSSSSSKKKTRKRKKGGADIVDRIDAARGSRKKQNFPRGVAGDDWSDPPSSLLSSAVDPEENLRLLALEESEIARLEANLLKGKRRKEGIMERRIGRIRRARVN